MNETKPLLKARKEVEVTLSPIWFLPIIAVIISVWLLVKLNLESKVPITIEMTNAQGITPGKTLIKFRGINAGKVTKVEVSEDLTAITVHAEIEPELSEYLTTETQFWVVRAQISLAGVSGLDTVLSGDYIAFSPGKSGDAKRQFIAQNSAPPISDDDPGLRITLTSENLGSISTGSQLYYRQIPIGEVRFYELSEDSRSVNISALIKPEYRKLVNQSTVFWNSGGVRLKGSLSGFEVRTESLSAIIAGGISLFTPDTQAAAIDTNNSFVLHESYDDAGVGVPIKISFPSGFDLKSGITKVKFHGINVGHLDSLNIVPDEDSGVVANVIIDPSAEPLLVKDTQFWLVKPELSINSLANLETLISGNYITMKVGDSTTSSREFSALDGPPPPDFQDPGLHVFLRANQMGSIAVDTPVLYRGVEVGRVANVFITDLAEGVSFHIHVRPEYAHLINETSRFWNASGLNISAGLGGIQIRSSSLMNIVRGGIEFETTDADADKVPDGHEFMLLDNPLASEEPLRITIQVPDANGWQPDVTTVRYKGMGIGVLKRLAYDHDTDQIIAHFDLNKNYQDLIREGTRFWLVSPRIEAAQVTGLNALFSGPYLTLKPGSGDLATEFILSDRPASLSANDPGLLLELKANEAMSIEVGSQVLYRQIPVGSVQAVQLLNDEVSFLVHIEAEHQDKVKADTRFWRASGIQVEASMAGIKVQSESLSAILAGGIAFGMSVNDAADAVTPGEQFKLFESESAAENAGQIITLVDRDASGVALGSGIRFKGLRIGEIIHQRLTANDEIELTAVLQEKYADLLNSGTRFWLAKPELGLTSQKNLAQLLSGPEVRVTRGQGTAMNRFILAADEPVNKTRNTGLNLVLEASRLGAIKAGVKIYYRQIAIGEVLGVKLGQRADRVQMFINIAPAYQNLIRDNSVFWNASGIQLQAGLFSGVDLRTESLESILSGGIAVATPDTPGTPVGQGTTFELNSELDDDWLDWSPQIELSQ